MNFGRSNKIALIYTSLVDTRASVDVYIDAGVGVDVDIGAGEPFIIGLGADYY